MTVSSKDSFTNYFSGGSESFKGTAQSVSQTFLTGRILEFTTDRYPLQFINSIYVIFISGAGASIEENISGL